MASRQRVWMAAVTLVVVAALAGCGKSPDSTVESFYRAVGKGEITEAKSYVSAQIVGMLGEAKLSAALAGETEKIRACGGIKSVEVKLQGEGEVRTGVATVAYAGRCQTKAERVSWSKKMASGSSQQISRVAVGAVVLLAALGADATRVLHAARPVVVAFADRAAEIELTDGDLVFRRGWDLVSRLVLSQGDAPRFSHVGVSVRIGGSTFVIHAVPADGASPGGVVREPLARFAASTGAVDLGAYRVRGLTPAARARVRDYALRQVGKPFDDAFSLRDDRRMYCTELVLKALTAGGVEIAPTVPSLRVPLLAEPVVPPDHFRLSPLLEPLVPGAGIRSALAAPAATIAHR